MAWRSWASLGILAIAVSAGCHSAPADETGASGAGGEAGDDPPVLSEATRRALRKLSPDELPPPPPDISNGHSDDPAAAAFGQKLFFDPGFSGPLLDEDNNGDHTSLGTLGESGRVACSGCHIPEAGFVDTRSVRQTVSLAAGWGHRKAPSLLDIGQAKIIMWDGRHDALFNQPFGALENAVEMNSSRLFAAQRIYAQHRSTYEAIFGKIPVPVDDPIRFPQLDGSTTGCRRLSATSTGIFGGVDCHGVPGDGAEFDGMSPQDQTEVTRIWANTGKAIAAYERLLTCGPSRFDAWMQGDRDALTPSEQRGAAVFVGQREDGTQKPGCDTCHSGPFLTDQAFHNVGLRPAGVGPAGTFLDLHDEGALAGLTAALSDLLNVRGAFSDGDDGRLPDKVPPSAKGAFRTPSLRCLGLRPSFMHTGQIRSGSGLESLVAFFDAGGAQSGFEGESELAPLGLTERERADLVAFLQTLDGKGPEARLLMEP